ncbi:MAG: hypothetical protein EBX40_08325 [Gammaproteobacteria bacterium]|nr:hypothetical protein [Gammaproteobacteria bacterium]
MIYLIVPRVLPRWAIPSPRLDALLDFTLLVGLDVDFVVLALINPPFLCMNGLFSSIPLYPPGLYG